MLGVYLRNQHSFYLSKFGVIKNDLCPQPSRLSPNWLLSNYWTLDPIGTVPRGTTRLFHSYYHFPTHLILFLVGQSAHIYCLPELVRLILRQNTWTDQQCMENYKRVRAPSKQSKTVCQTTVVSGGTSKVNTMSPAILNLLNLKQRDKPQTGSRLVCACLHKHHQ